MSASLAASAKEPVQCCVSFIIIIVGTLGISGGTVRRSRLLARLLRCPPRRDSATGTPRSAEQGVRLAVARGFIHPGRNNSASPMCCGRILNDLPQACPGQDDLVLCQNVALLKKTTNQQLRRPWNPRRIQGISRRRADFRPMG